jgi:hypothetical protein
MNIYRAIKTEYTDIDLAVSAYMCRPALAFTSSIRNKFSLEEAMEIVGNHPHLVIVAMVKLTCAVSKKLISGGTVMPSSVKVFCKENGQWSLKTEILI